MNNRVPVQVKEFLNLLRFQNTRLTFVAFAFRSSIAETAASLSNLSLFEASYLLGVFPVLFLNGKIYNGK